MASDAGHRIKRITQRNIAEKLGVSRTVVSYALNDRPDGYGNVAMHPDLREAIKRTAAEMGYKPDRVAAALGGGHSKTVAVISQLGENQISIQRVHSICHQLQENGYEYMLQIASSGDGMLKNFEKTIDLLEGYRIGGYIIHQICFSGSDNARAEKLLLDTGKPVVQVATSFSKAFPRIDVDYFGAGYQLAQHIIDLGRRKLVGVSLASESPGVRERFQGIKSAVDKTQGAYLRKFHCVPDPLVSFGSAIEQGYSVTEKLLSELLPDAIFYSNDHMACGGLNALVERGVKVPGDVAITGFDGVTITKYTVPPITTAEQPVSVMAEKVVTTLAEMMRNSAYNPPSLTTVPCNLVFRESSRR